MIPHSKTYIGENDLAAVQSVLQKGTLTANKLKNLFQERLTEILQVGSFRLSTSGTMAFYKILLALGFKKGDEVLMPDYICETLLIPITVLGGIIVLYDNDKDRWLSSVEQIMAKITKKTKVVLINHTFGFIFKDVERLKASLPTNTYLVEDCCHTLAPSLNIRSNVIGKFSICCFYSFNSTKYLATGEGGAISTNDESFLIELDNFNIGDNLSDLNCSLGLAQLKHLNWFVDRRAEIAAYYFSHFNQLIPQKADYDSSLFFRFPLLIENNEVFWINEEVAFRKGVDSLLSEKLQRKSLLNAKSIIDRTVSLPIYPALTDNEMKLITQITEYLVSKCR